MKRIFFFLHFFAFASYISAQTGPGGVGNSSSNLIWLEADNISSLSDGDAISSWNDGSGNTNNLSQGTASFQPQYKTNIINGKPVVRFYQALDRLVLNPFVSPTTAITAIYVNSNLESDDGLISYTSSTENDFLIYRSNNIEFFRGTNTVSGVSANDGNFHIMNVGWQSSGGNMELWKDGNQTYTTTMQAGTSITSGGSLAIGADQDSPDGGYESFQNHSGDFAEVILFNTFLNEAQNIIVSNYLAAKYNLSISNDYYAHKSTHGNDVAGIGREDASNTHTAAMSANILQLENPSALNANQEYLLFGHDNADITTSWTTTEAPDAGVNIQRLAREWRIEETGDLGTVDVLVDVNSFPGLPAGHTMYTIMVDSDGDFSNGASVYEMTLSAGTEYEVTGIEVADGDYLAIAVVDPTIDHETSSSNDFEPNNATVNVTLNFIPSMDRTVSYNTTDGTALSAQPDYTAVVGGSLTIIAGNQSASYTINITNDVQVETSEAFTITLSSPSAGIDLGANAVHSYTIKDDDNSRKIYFSLASSAGLEAVSPVNITIAINNIDAVNPTTVDYAVIGGTASGGGVDYTLASGTASIAAGTSSTNISLTITPDLLYELDETIIIELSNPSNCNLDGVMPYGGTGFLEYTYTITNDDASPEIEFDISLASGDEGTSPISIQYTLNEASGVDASATYTLSGTATGSGSDYTLSNGSISILAGNTSGSISVPITNDGIEELEETIILTLSVPINSSLGSNPVYTYTITDNDNSGYLGPGGVGDSDNNILWVKSNDLTVVADGTDITSWLDASGNSHNLTQGNTSYTPRYYSNVINSQPVVRFEQSDNRIIHNSFTDFPTSEITTYFVNSNNDSNDGLISYATGASNNEYLLFNSGDLRIYREAANNASGMAINGSAFGIISNTWRSSDGSAYFYRNGTQTYTVTIGTGIDIVAGGCLAIAGEQDGVNSGYDDTQAHQGDFTEIFIYNEVLNSARRKIVDNYLSAKYDLAISNDLYAYDSPGNYEHEVAGIGSDDNDNFHLDAQGTAIVRINNASSIGSGDFLLWGHDNADRTLDTVDVPMTVDNRMNRVWRVDETGDIGSVSVNFDLSAFTIGNSSDLVLLIDSDDGSFVNSNITAISSFSSDIATFDLIDFSAGNWFTVASLSDANPLPIELIEFSAYYNGKEVELLWKTATEINNSSFNIERSIDLENWQIIGAVKGAGNSNQVLTYDYLDSNPIQGEVSYYRLKQIDFDGGFSYSNIESLKLLNNKRNNLKIYPNPFLNRLIIEGSENQLKSIQIYNLMGQNLYYQLNVLNSSKNRIVYDMSKFTNGIYLVKTLDDSKRIIKNNLK